MRNIEYKLSDNELRLIKNCNWIFTLLLTLVVLLLTSCESLLEEEPRLVAEESFYNTALEVETAVNAIYEPLRKLPDAGLVGINSALGEFCYGRGSWSWLNNYDGLNGTWITRTSNMWAPLYLGIRNANLVVLNLSNNTVLSPEVNQELLGEARFLRAFAYFNLIKNWGAVPLRTEENLELTDIARSPINEVYEQIIIDLNYAEANLPDNERLRGAPSKWVAKTLLADVYLSMENFTEASNKANEVIQSGKYALLPIETTDDYQNIFSAGVAKNSEEIFYALYTHDQGFGSVWPGLLNHPGTGFYANSGVYGVHGDSTNPAYMNWDDNDLRKGLWYPWEFGVSPTTLLSKKFIDPETLGLDRGSNPVTLYRYADLLLIYAEADSKVNGVTESSMEALNQVHRRAYGFDPINSSPVDYSVQDYDSNTFVDLIIKERGYEFQLEGKRWPELKRTGKADEIIMDIRGKSLSEKNYLWPIPINEFNFNLALDPATDQNPGY